VTYWPSRTPLVPIAFSLLVAACGSSSTISPTAPSGVTMPSPSSPPPGTVATPTPSQPNAPVTGGATITGRVSTTSALLAASTGEPSVFSPALAATADAGTLTVSVAGGPSTTVGASGDFTLTGVPSGSVQLRFSGRGTDATITISGVQATDRIQISVALTSRSAAVEAEHREHDNRGVEVNGRITALGAGTLTVGTSVVTVPPSAIIRHGSRTLTLAELKVGDKVEVKGTRTGTGVTATEVKVQTGGTGSDMDDEDDDDEDEDKDDKKGSSSSKKETELSGAVASLGTTACPTLTFVIKGTTVSTTATTKFDGLTCASIKVGTALEVKGTLTGTTLVATKVERD
jgi:Domain of unknown function (DUF5666)